MFVPQNLFVNIHGWLFGFNSRYLPNKTFFKYLEPRIGITFERKALLKLTFKRDKLGFDFPGLLVQLFSWFLCLNFFLFILLGFLLDFRTNLSAKCESCKGILEYGPCSLLLQRGHRKHYSNNFGSCVYHAMCCQRNAPNRSHMC